MKDKIFKGALILQGIISLCVFVFMVMFALHRNWRAVFTTFGIGFIITVFFIVVMINNQPKG
jgi:hypothetical protein